MAQVIPRRGGYYSDFRANKKRIMRFLSKDKREAQIELGKLMESVRAKNSGRPEKNIPWPQFRAEYLEWSKGAKKPQTYDRDLYAIRALEKEFPISHLSQITPRLLDSLKSRRLSHGVGKHTVARDVSAVKAMMHKSEGWGYGTKQDWAVVKKIKIARKKLHFHTIEQLGKLLRKCKGVWLTIALLASRAGLRREEIHTLIWTHVELDRKNAKGDPAPRLQVAPVEVEPGMWWEPKDYEQRWIPIPPDLCAHLRAIKKKSKSRFVIAAPDDYIPNLKVMTAYMRKLSRKCGLKGSIHILRHTYASHLVQNGESIKKVKELLGHESLATTEIYAELAPEQFDSGELKLPVIPGFRLAST